MAVFLALILLGMAWAWWQIAWMPGRRWPDVAESCDARAANICDHLQRDLAALAGDIGERNVSHRYEQLLQAAEFIEQNLSSAGYEVERQELLAGGKTVWNVCAEHRGSSLPEEIVVVGAHFDTVPGSPGANDNGSAVVANLALARAFASATTDRTVRFAFFVNEEWPYYMTPAMGSLRYAQACRSKDENVVGMIALETIGCYVDRPQSQQYPLRPLYWLYPSTGNFLAFVGNLRSRRWVHEVIRGFRQAGFPSQGIAAPEFLRDIFRSDHAAFWHCGYPALMVTDTANFRYSHYHTAQDTHDKISYEKLAQVVAGLEHSLKVLAASKKKAGV